MRLEKTTEVEMMQSISSYINPNTRGLTSNYKNTAIKDKETYNKAMSQHLLNPVEDLVQVLKTPIKLAKSSSLSRLNNSVNIAEGQRIRVNGGHVLTVTAHGVEAQTLANVYLALDHDLDVMPVINKIDLPSAEPDRVIEEIEDIIGIEAHDAPLISAKTGLNVDQVLEQIVEKIPAPGGDPKAPLKALIFDSLYDSYKGVIVFCRLREGTVKKGTKIRMMATGAEADVVEIGRASCRERV